MVPGVFAPSHRVISFFFFDFLLFQSPYARLYSRFKQLNCEDLKASTYSPLFTYSLRTKRALKPCIFGYIL